jgi:hypothetical protein
MINCRDVELAVNKIVKLELDKDVRTTQKKHTPKKKKKKKTKTKTKTKTLLEPPPPTLQFPA